MGDFVKTFLLFFVSEGWSRVPEFLRQDASEPLFGLTIRQGPLLPSESIIPSNGPGAAIGNTIEWEGSTGRVPTMREIFPKYNGASFDFDDIRATDEDSSIGDPTANLFLDSERSSSSRQMLWDDQQREISVDAYRRQWAHSSVTTQNLPAATNAESFPMHVHASLPVESDDIRVDVPPIHAYTPEAAASLAGAHSEIRHVRRGVPGSNLATTENKRAPSFADPITMCVHASQNVGLNDSPGQERPFVSGFTDVSDSHFSQSGVARATDTENVFELTEVSTHSYALVGRKRKHHRAHVEDVRSTSKARKTDGDREITLEGRSALLRAMHEDPSASINTLLQVLVAGNHENDYRKVTYFRENLRRLMRMDLDVHDQMVIHYDILSQGNVEEFGRMLGGPNKVHGYGD